MTGYRPNDFGSAHSDAIMAGLKARVRKNTWISDGYTFINLMALWSALTCARLSR